MVHRQRWRIQRVWWDLTRQDEGERRARRGRGERDESPMRGEVTSGCQAGRAVYKSIHEGQEEMFPAVSGRRAELCTLVWIHPSRCHELYCWLSSDWRRMNVCGWRSERARDEFDGGSIGGRWGGDESRTLSPQVERDRHEGDGSRTGSTSVAGDRRVDR